MSLMDDDLLDPLCDHENDPMMCPVATCNPRGQDPPPSIGPEFEAKFPGHCRYGNCVATDIEEGDALRMVNGVAWHAECALAVQ